MTSTTTIEIEEYYDRVRAALSGLPPEIRDDLLEDLPDHLAEVLAEGDGSLRDRLGEPDAYAAELRAAAGVEASDAPTPHRLHAAVERATELAHRFDVRTGRLIGYPRLMDLLHAIRPGWWVLRGWIVAQFIAGTHDRSSWHGFIPSVGGSKLVGFICAVAVIAGSVWIGRRSLRFADWPRRLMFVASAIIAAWAVFVLADNVGGTYYSYGGTASDVSPYNGYPDGSDATDLYVYDKDGNPVVGARLFDQNGNPIQFGSGVCQDGSIAPGTGPDGTAQTWTYPLCPADPGPFRSGPGPLPQTASGSTAPTSPTDTPSGVSTASPTAPKGKPSGSRPATTKPTH